MTRNELTDLLELDTTINTYLTDDDWEEAINDASRETGWALPVSGDFKELWIKNRAKRHCFFLLWTQSAHKFKVKQYSLNQRFDHYGDVIKKMDSDFQAAMEEHPEQFAGVEVYKMFGNVARPGLEYDITGRDITDYDWDTDSDGSWG